MTTANVATCCGQTLQCSCQSGSGLNRETIAMGWGRSKLGLHRAQLIAHEVSIGVLAIFWWLKMATLPVVMRLFALCRLSRLLCGVWW